MGEYQSPFQLPDITECTAPHEARQYPIQHMESEVNRCPYHYNRWERLKKIPPKIDNQWRQWAKWREEYAKPGISDEARDQAMREMLSYVTTTNPPEVVSKTYAVRQTKTKTWHDIDGRPHSYTVEQRRPSDGKLVLVSAASIILAVCMLICFLAILL